MGCLCTIFVLRDCGGHMTKCYAAHNDTSHVWQLKRVGTLFIHN